MGDQALSLVLFDCDGTLVDSAGSIHHCMVETFREFALAVPDMATTRSVIGLSLDLAIARVGGFDLEDAAVYAAVQQMVASYKRHFQALRTSNMLNEALYPGILALLETLQSYDHLLLGIVTGKSRRGLDAVLAHHGLDGFCVSRTADDCRSKPDPAMVLECCHATGIDPSHTIVVGDASYDMQMAVAAGAMPVAVSWGYQSIAALTAAGARHILHQPSDLLALTGK